jgi:hypothetical protein
MKIKELIAIPDRSAYRLERMSGQAFNASGWQPVCAGGRGICAALFPAAVASIFQNLSREHNRFYSE